MSKDKIKAVKERVRSKFKNKKLTKEEIEALKEDGNEELLQYSRKLLRESKG